MERYSPAVFSAALRVLCQHPDAQEVTQDVFWTLWRSPDRFDTGRGRLATWLVILSRSRALDVFRRLQANAARTGEFGVEIWNRRPPSIAHAPDDGILFKELLGRLPEKQSAVVQQVYFEGYALSEVAAMERAPIGTIKGRARLALKKLRSELRGDGSNSAPE
jgi:RNA polymerase sigma-70 factor (ECF subfamily)